MRISGITLEVDVYAYITSKSLRSVRLVGNNVTASCPYHNDNRPSFGVNVDTGMFNCYGCGAKGTFASLVKHLDGFPTVFDAEQYLIALFGRYDTSTDDPIVLSFEDDTGRSDYEIPLSALENVTYDPDVLSNRGLNKRWTTEFGIGYNIQTDGNKRSYVLPYRCEHGRLVTLKHRSVAGKSFWYDPPMNAGVKARILYGMDAAIRYNVKRLAVTEGEIDCISVWQACYDEDAIGCVALGGKTLSDEQAAVLQRHLTSDTEIIVMTDNDGAGRLAREQIADKLLGRYNVTGVDWPSDVKDANDVTMRHGDHRLRRIVAERKPIGLNIGIS